MGKGPVHRHHGGSVAPLSADPPRHVVRHPALQLSGAQGRSERPVAAATAVMPPHPMAIASHAAQRRRTFSSITGGRAWYLFRTSAMIAGVASRTVQPPAHRAGLQRSFDSGAGSCSPFPPIRMPGMPVQSMKLSGRGEYNSNRKFGRVFRDSSLAELPSRLERATHGESRRDTREKVGFLEPSPRQGFAQHASKDRDAGGASSGKHEVDLVRGQAGRRDRQLNDICAPRRPAGQPPLQRRRVSADAVDGGRH